MGKEKKKVLIVIDVQNDFVYGSLGTPEAQEVIPNIKKKFDKYKNNNDYVIFTKDTHDSDYLATAEGKKLPVEHCIRGTSGWEIVDEINYKGFKNLNNFMVCCKSTFGFDDWVCYIISIYSIVSYAICYFTHIEPSRLMFANCSIAWIIIMLQALRINELKKHIRLNSKRK